MSNVMHGSEMGRSDESFICIRLMIVESNKDVAKWPCSIPAWDTTTQYADSNWVRLW